MHAAGRATPTAVAIFMVTAVFVTADRLTRLLAIFPN
jgi:hypothetical protein